MKKTGSCAIALFCLILSSTATSETLKVPNLDCTLSLKNDSLDSQRVLLSWRTTVRNEKQLELWPDEDLQIQLNQFEESPRFFELNLVNHVVPSLTCGKQTLNKSDLQKLTLPQNGSQKAPGKLQITNTSPVAQTLQILVNSQASTIELKGYETFTQNLEANTVEVKSIYPVLAWIQTQDGLTSFEHTSSQTLNPDEHASYFEMAGPHATDASYIVKITDPNQAAILRARLNNPEQPLIIVGQISYGHGQFNRNLKDPGHPAWSWHITNPQISEVGSMSCDGSPEIIETVLPEWMKTVGYICFWNYHPTREVAPSEL